jgi:hypothetical protein
MHATILDTNILRGSGDDEFSALIASESAAGVIPLVDGWTLLEMLANLEDPQSKSYRPSRSGIRRAVKRSFVHPHSLVMPSEAQLTTLLFGAEPPGLGETLATIAECCRIVADARDSDDLSAIHPTVLEIAGDLASKEQWFADYFSEFVGKLKSLPPSLDANGQPLRRNAQVRAFLRSEEAMRLDAIAMAKRAYAQMGLSCPDPIPDEQLAKVMAASRGGSLATAVALETVVIDGANLASKDTRNLIWDQEVGFQIGQQVQGKPVLIVSEDRFFPRAAALGGFQERVQTKAVYFKARGVPSAV